MIKIIEAKEGMWLTNGEVYSKKVFNPIGDWRDATKEEKEKWDEEHKIEDNEIR